MRLKEETLTYNGTEQRVHVKDVTLDGMQLEPSCYGAVGETTAEKNAGSYTARVAGRGNYGGFAEAEWQITGKAAALAAKDCSKVYGETDPTFVAASSGTVGGDQRNYTLTREEGEDAGAYHIRVVPGKNPNYIVETGEGILTIEKASVAVAAEAKTKRYGEGDPELTATVTGVIGGDELAYTLARARGENAGEYAITVSPGTNRNYHVTAAGAVFTIAKADAAVAAEAKTKRYGEGDPELTATVTGVIGGDELAYTLARARGENAGEYAITVSPGMNRNYNVKASGAVFTITKADTAVVTPPGAKKLIETGSLQELVTAGTAEGGEMRYALGGDLPSAWSAHIPTAAAAGTYTCGTRRRETGTTWTAPRKS